MKSIQRRIEKIEDKLNLGQQQRRLPPIVIYDTGDKERLPENIGEWITYKTALAETPPGCLLPIFFSGNELAARGLPHGRVRRLLIA